MDAIDFRKERAEYLLDCIATGKPIKPTDDSGWTRHDLVGLAGACYFAALSHGPMGYVAALGDTEKAQKALDYLHDEHREAVDEAWQNDLHAAIGFYGHLTMLVADGGYDAQYEPHLTAAVSLTGEIERKLMPHTGFKSLPESDSVAPLVSEESFREAVDRLTTPPLYCVAPLDDPSQPASCPDGSICVWTSGEKVCEFIDRNELEGWGQIELDDENGILEMLRSVDRLGIKQLAVDVETIDQPDIRGFPIRPLMERLA